MVHVNGKALIAVGGVAVVVIAGMAGSQSAKLLKKWGDADRLDKYRTESAEQTATILQQMNTVKVGDTLADFTMDDIDGQTHKISELVPNQSLIIYMRPDCGTCLEELEQLREAAKVPSDYTRVIVISSASPFQMRRVRDDYSLPCVILYDDDRRFGNSLNIQTFPFNLVVDRSRKIERIYACMLIVDDYRRLFASGTEGQAATALSTAVTQP